MRQKLADLLCFLGFFLMMTGIWFRFGEEAAMIVAGVAMMAFSIAISRTYRRNPYD